MSNAAKFAFQNTAILKIMPALYQSGVGFEIRPPHAKGQTRPTLIINGSLKVDIIGLDMDIEVKGFVEANLDITGNLNAYYIDTTGNKTVKASSLEMSVSSVMTGNGCINIAGDIKGSLSTIEGKDGHLTVISGGNLSCGKIKLGANVIAHGLMSVNDEISSSTSPHNPYFTSITANVINVGGKIQGSNTTVIAALDLRAPRGVCGGAKAYAGNHIRVDEIGIPKGHGCGTKGRTLVIAQEVITNNLPYEADILSNNPVRAIRGEFYNPYQSVEGYCWPAEETPSKMITFDDAQSISPGMIDFIRLASERLNKTFGTQTPLYVSTAIKKAFSPV